MHLQRLAPWLTALALTLPAAAFAQSTAAPGRVSGADAPSGASFSAEEAGDVVTARVRLRDGKAFTATVDYSAKTVTIKTQRSDPAVPAVLLADEKQDLKTLGAGLRGASGRAGDALASLVSVLGEAPLGKEVDLTAKAGDTPSEDGIRSLCRYEGQTRVAKWDVDDKNRQRRVTVGPCYDRRGADKCLGRCGAGCSANEVEGEGNPTAVQRFTQDCLNHDVCNARTGDVLGDCADEFAEAVDDFFFAPDCGDMDGAWTDGNGFTWSLRQSGDFDLKGHVQTPSNGQFKVVSGYHKGGRYVIRAESKRDDASCRRFTYRGNFNSCTVAEVKVDGCNFSNTTMTRD